MLDFGLKQNPKYATSIDKKQNWIIFNRLSVIQNQHRRLVVGHPVYEGEPKVMPFLLSLLIFLILRFQNVHSCSLT